MLRNYFRLAFQNFRKHRLFSIINLLGLTMGVTCCLMIFLFILNETSYDNFHKNGKDIYRVMRVGTINGEQANIPYLSAPYGTALAHDYPDAIKSMTRVMHDNDLIGYNQVYYNEKNILLVDSNFFEFFSFPLVKGNPAEVLRDAYSIVMTESAAKKYFGNEDPIGKVIDFNKKDKFKVTGIVRDVPANSHLTFDMVVPFAKWSHDNWFNQWPNNGLFVYLQLNPRVDPNRLIAQFPSFMDKYMGKFYRENGFKMGLTMHPLKDIYFEGESPFDNVKHGSKKTVIIFMSIAVLVLVIACINFMNMATARATDRSKEVGLRKVLGALRGQLTWQFIFESTLFATIAVLLSVLLLRLLLPAYNNFLGYRLPAYGSNPWFYIFLAGTILVVGLLAGSYPALMMSAFSPIESLRGKFKRGTGGALFRKTLVVFQFGISVLLIIGIIVMVGQMRYLRNSDMGFNKEQALIVSLDNGPIWNHKLNFKEAVQRDPAVSSASLMTGEPGGFHDSYTFETEAFPNDKISMNTEYADFEYPKTLGLKIIAGRALSGQYPSDTATGVLINRTAAKTLGYTPQQAIGKWLKNVMRDSLRRQIVGVVEDYHFASLKQTIGPLVISPDTNDRRLMLIKLNTGNYKSAIDRLSRIYSSLATDYPFEYRFLDEKFNALYKSEDRQETLLTVFALIAIGIACLGLFGLASYTAIKRTKEIGVRKVLGSSVPNIVALLTKDLLWPVLIGTLIAMPLGYLAMAQWLQGFAYRIPIRWWYFAVAIAVAMTIALLTVSVQAIKAATANPVKSLRSE